MCNEERRQSVAGANGNGAHQTTDLSTADDHPGALNTGASQGHREGPSEDIAEDDLRIAGPLRRNAGLLLVIAAAVVLGPLFSRYLSTYRAVVLAVNEGQMFIAKTSRPPVWVDGVVARPGAMIEKTIGSWHAAETPPRAQDLELQKLYARYVNSYEGIIRAINAPVAPGAASTAVIELTGGKRIHLPLWADHLAAAAVGVRVRKTSGSWDPVLVTDAPAASLASPPPLPESSDIQPSSASPSPQAVQDAAR